MANQKQLKDICIQEMNNSYNIQEFLDNLISFKKYCIKNYIDRLSEFINSFKNLSDERQNILLKYDTNKETSFNIFEDLSIVNKFNEMEHSKIIKKILDSNNEVIGDKRHLEIFLQLIKTVKSNICIDGFSYNDYIVEREKVFNEGRIDIIIHENKEKGKCIVIENKITGKASDQENQLARYFNIVKNEMDKNLVAIVYLPFYYQNPSDCNFVGIYKDYKDKILPILCIIPAIDQISKKDLVYGFLDKCVELSKEDDMTKAVCLEQYSNFIKSKADKEKITMINSKEILEKLLSTEDNITIAKNISEIWSNKENIIYEAMKKQLEDNQYHLNNQYYIKELDANNEVCIYFYQGQIGFWHLKGKFKLDIQNILEEIIKSEERNNFIKFEGKNKEWVYAKYNIDKILGTYDDMFKYILMLLDKFKNEANEKLKNIL